MKKVKYVTERYDTMEIFDSDDYNLLISFANSFLFRSFQCLILMFLPNDATF